jgi:hypothetical protein
MAIEGARIMFVMATLWGTINFWERLLRIGRRRAGITIEQMV